MASKKLTKERARELMSHLPVIEMNAEEAKWREWGTGDITIECEDGTLVFKPKETDNKEIGNWSKEILEQENDSLYIETDENVALEDGSPTEKLEVKNFAQTTEHTDQCDDGIPGNEGAETRDEAPTEDE